MRKAHPANSMAGKASPEVHFWCWKWIDLHKSIEITTEYSEYNNYHWILYHALCKMFAALTTRVQEPSVRDWFGRSGAFISYHPMKCAIRCTPVCRWRASQIIRIKLACNYTHHRLLRARPCVSLWCLPSSRRSAGACVRACPCADN